MKKLLLASLFFGIALCARATESKVVTVAGLKLIPVPWEKAANFSKMEKYARIAAAGGAKVIVTSECYLDGYLGAKTGVPGMTPEKLSQAAEPVDGAYSKRAAALAKELHVYLLFGFSERGPGVKTFNSALLFGPSGEVVGHYSKMHTNGEFYEPGNELPVFDTAIGRVGILICFDRQMPETSRTLALKGADLILVPANSPHVSELNEDLMMRVRAYENDLFVLLVNPYNTLAVNSEGEIIAHNPDRLDEGIVYAKMDLTARAKHRKTFEQRRPEMYGELVKPKS